MYQFKAKESKVEPYPFCLVNSLKDFTVDNTKKKTELNGYYYDFFVDTNKILDTHSDLKRKNRE